MEEKGNSFIKQALILAMAGLLVRFIGFLYRLPLTNLIGDEGNGIYSLGFIIYNFLFILSAAGLPSTISKMVSERRARGEYVAANNVFRVSMKMAIVSGLVGASFMWFFAENIANMMNSPRSHYAILTLAPTVFIVAIMSVLRGYFQGMNNTVPTAISQVAEQVFNAIFSVWLAYIFVTQSLEMGVAGGTAGTGVGAVVGLIVMASIYFLARPRIRKQLKKDKTKNTESQKKIASELLRTAIPMVAGTAIFSISGLIDAAMVLDILSAEDSVFDQYQADALYGMLAGKYVLITTLPVAVATSLAVAIIPSIAASHVSGDEDAVKNKVNLGLRVIMMFSIPAAVGIGVLADPILLMLFPAHPEGGLLLQVGAASVVVLAMTQIATGMLQGINLIWVPVIAAFFGALVKIPLNLLLIPIPEINVIGAVISTTVCYIVAAAINLTVLSIKTKTKPDLMGVFIKPTISAVMMGAACYGIFSALYMFSENNTLSTIVSIFLSAIVYFIFMLLLNGIDRSDIEMLPFGKKISAMIDNFGE